MARPHGGATGLSRFIDFIDENGGGPGAVSASVSGPNNPSKQKLGSELINFSGLTI